jgi:hypothetical protein
MNIYKKLLQIQQQIISLEVDKEANGYKYLTGAKLMGYIKPLMNELGLVLKQEIVAVKTSRQDYTLANGKSKSEILVEASMKFTWVDTDTGEKDENMFSAMGQNGWDKGLGSALTYGERYFLMKYFHLSTDEDDLEVINVEREKEEAKANKKAKTTAELQAIVKTFDETKKERLKALLGSKKWAEHTQLELNKIFYSEMWI